MRYIDEWDYQAKAERARYEREPKVATCPMAMQCIEGHPTCATCKAGPPNSPDAKGGT